MGKNTRKILFMHIDPLFDPLHPNIGINILHTVLYTFPKVLIRRICLTV